MKTSAVLPSSARYLGIAVALLAGGACSSSPSGNQAGLAYNAGVPGIAYTWAGVIGQKGFGSQSSSDNGGDGHPINESWLYYVQDLTFAPDGTAWVNDWNNHRVRRVETDGTFKTVIGADYEGDGSPGETDRLPLGTTMGCSPTDVALNHPTDIKFMPDGTAVLAAWHNNKIRVVDAKTGLLKVLTGNSYGFAGDGKPAYEGVFNQPKSIAIDAEGKIYTIDQRNERIRVIGTDADRTVSTIAGTCLADSVFSADGNVMPCDRGTTLQNCPNSKTVTYCTDVTNACRESACAPGYVGDGAVATSAQFGFDSSLNTPQPSGALALRGSELYIADSLNNRIRKIDLTTNLITCVAGADCPIAFTFNNPNDLEFGPDGRLYVANQNANAVEAIDLALGTVERVAGNGQPCATSKCVESGEGHTALELQLNWPSGITFDAHGDLYIADQLNSRIVRIAK